MKAFKFIMSFLILFSMTLVTASFAQTQQIKTKSGTLVNYGSIRALTTVGNTLTHIDSLKIPDNTVGILEVQVAGTTSTGIGVSGWSSYRYHKTAGTLTVDSVTVLSQTTAETGLGAGTFAVGVTASNNLQLKVKGNTSLTVKWRTRMRVFDYYNF